MKIEQINKQDKNCVIDLRQYCIWLMGSSLYRQFPNFDILTNDFVKQR